MTFTEDHAPLMTEMLEGWRLARKVRPIKAKLSTEAFEALIIPKLHISTLEGIEQTSPTSMICLGEANDIWQQTQTALFKKYDVVGIDIDGWLICNPKPSAIVEFYQFTGKIVTRSSEHYVKALWGEKFRTYGLCQRFAEGDYICRDINNKSDVWVVRKKLFENTYTIINPE